MLYNISAIYVFPEIYFCEAATSQGLGDFPAPQNFRKP